MTQPEKIRQPAGFRAVRRSDDDAPRPAGLAIAAVALALVAALVGLDLAGDARAGGSGLHLALEVGIMLAALGGAAALVGQVFAARRRAGALARDLDRAEADLARFRAESQELLRGLSRAIDRQFDRWALSGAEREVALLLLKGLALKDIAALRETSERTVRQQSLAVYKKAGLSGRAELAAFFLEDLLVPEQSPGAGTGASAASPHPGAGASG